MLLEGAGCGLFFFFIKTSYFKRSIFQFATKTMKEYWVYHWLAKSVKGVLFCFHVTCHITIPLEEGTLPCFSDIYYRGFIYIGTLIQFWSVETSTPVLVTEMMYTVSDIDAVQTRVPIDVHAKPNQHGLEFLEFFNEAKLCTLNGRGDKHKDNFTCINTHGKSVVDFMCVFHDWLSYCSDFEVNTSGELISMYNLESCVGDPKHIPDH